MFTDSLLALALLLTTASQLRLSGLPIGPGELLLTLWLSLVVMRSLLMGELRMSYALSRLMVFWLLFTVSLGIGTVVAFATRESFDPEWFLHDAMAYPLLAAVSCLTVADPRAQVNRVAWCLAILGGVSFAILAAGANGLVPLPFDPWFWENFRGWSQNPNQLSELSGVLALVCLHLLDTSTRLTGRVTALFCMATAIYIGLLTRNDTFKLALIAAIPIFFLLKLYTSVKLGRTPLAMITMIGLVVLPVSAAPLLWEEVRATDLIGALSKKGNEYASHEADLRKSLWHEAFNRGFFDAWMLGLGPGPHLMIPDEIIVAHMDRNAPSNTVHPQPDGMANFEAHNTVLDLFTQGGLLAVGSVIWLLAIAWRRTFRLRFPGLMALLCGLGVLFMTANLIRLPVVWFGLTLCLDAERKQSKAGYFPARELTRDRLEAAR
jgi:hypothetical protein